MSGNSGVFCGVCHKELFDDDRGVMVHTNHVDKKGNMIIKTYIKGNNK